ncbi:E3 UBIQUITIN-PROTEIN LIGASE RNF13-LIKE [Salix viminalis]|uniref:RING-type E3 ubiquitin transferase n=1 Tax=Salix viminalis TaxID=40686 RepID=A0A6N2MR34_SALVM|nr:E3 UBIQUITIN-PROTEIN LIGASE RNF13-LIKE [Salix viminalis]
MNWVLLQIKENTFPSPTQQPYFLSQPPSRPNLETDGFNLNAKVSPSLLLIIIILAIFFFVSGLLHLLVRFLLRPPNGDPDDLESVTALQGQLHQLFHLHDAGVDQIFIDSLPVFQYKAIIGLKNPFDCAVCLCEFDPEDQLRLLPKCSHAFHMECIDTWLLSHSTCPLCRACLLSDFSPNNSYPPFVLVLESGSESSRELVSNRDANVGRTSSVSTTHSNLGCHGDADLGSSRLDISQKSSEILTKDDSDPKIVVDSGEKVVPVKLGKYRNLDVGEGSSTNNVDSRRCYSMGSFEYVLDENSSLQVPIRTLMKKQSSNKTTLPLTPGQKPAMSECDCESRREFDGFQGLRNAEVNESASIVASRGNAIGRSQRESLSRSKIWLRGRKEKQNPTEDSSRRAFSFRFPLNKNVVSDDDLKMNKGDSDVRRTNSEISFVRWENGGGQSSCNVQNQSCHTLELLEKTPSFARTTLLWLVGRQNKVVHSYFTSNV